MAKTFWKYLAHIIAMSLQVPYKVVYVKILVAFAAYKNVGYAMNRYPLWSAIDQAPTSIGPGILTWFWNKKKKKTLFS